MNGISLIKNALYRGEHTTFNAMLDTIIALMPAIVAGFVYFGYRAVLIPVCGVTGAVAAEFIFQKLTRCECSYRNLSAVVTGLTAAMCMSPMLPPVICILCCTAAVTITRLSFGGTGKEIVEPAAFGAVLPAVSFPILSNVWCEAFTGAQTASTPLTAENTEFTTKQLLFGAHPGAVGEVGTLFLLIGAAYLLVRRVITPVIPLCMTVTTIAFSLAFGTNLSVTLFGGGLVLCAFFIAPNPAVTPTKLSGQVVFGCFCGLVYVLLQWRSPSNQSVYFAVLLANLLVPLFNKIPEFGKAQEDKNE